MLIKLVRFLRGYIVFTLSGKYPERLINLLNNNGIVYWNLLPEKDFYTGCMLLGDYRKIRKSARKASVKLKCEKRVGLPFIIKKYSSRKGIFIGAVSALILMYSLSSFIWSVHINGAENLSRSKIINALESSGLKAGAYKSGLDFESIERELLLKVPEIRWVSVNALNGIAEVEIKEKLAKPKLKTKKYPCNLTAYEDGVITDTLVNSGTCEVKRGSAVVKNQLLVSCVVKGTNEAEDKLSFVHSDGEIFADVNYKEKFIIPKKNNNIILNSNYIEKSNIVLLHLSFPFLLNCSSPDTNIKSFYRKNLRANGVELPLGFDSVRIYDIKKSESIITKEKAKILLEKKASLFEIFNYGKYKIKSKNYSIKELKDKFVLRAHYKVNKNIAEPKRVKISKKVE